MADIGTLISVLSLLGAIFIAIIIFAVLSYIYFSLTLMFTAKRLGVKGYGIAWIPLVNFFLYPKMAKKSSWPLIFVFIPVFYELIINVLFGKITTQNAGAALVVSYIIFAIAIVGAVFGISWFIGILKARGKPWWWILLLFIPIFNLVWMFIMWGILAWGKDKEVKSSSNKFLGPNTELVHYLKKYKAEGYTTAELRTHLISVGQNPAEIDEAIRHL